MGCWNGVEGLAAAERQALAGDMGWPGEHHRPRGTGGTHPGRNLSVRNVVTPSRSGFWSGKPTVRRAQLPGGNRMTEKRMPVAERQRETGTRMAGPSARRPA